MNRVRVALLAELERVTNVIPNTCSCGDGPVNHDCNRSFKKGVATALERFNDPNYINGHEGIACKQIREHIEHAKARAYGP